jgi:DNA polymerase-1
MTADLAGISRKQAKTTNLGLAYGMGKRKLSESLGLSLCEGSILYNKYHSALPFIQAFSSKCSRMAEVRGWVKTISGRRRRFNLYGPYKYSGEPPLPYDEARQKWGEGIKRYYTYRAMNGVIQGSSADLMKMLLVELYKINLTPNMTIHDEVCKSITGKNEAEKIKDVMENFYKLSVPLKADIEIGESWGELE